MRLYRFIDEDKNIDAVVVTDGSCDQKRVFITEIRGIISPGDVSATEEQVKGSNELLKLGFPWKVGHSVMHQELVDFAETKGLVLEITPQGLNELVDVTEKIRYTFTAKTSKLSFPNTESNEKAVVTSYKQKYVNGKPSGSQTALEVTFETDLPYLVSKDGTVTISENPTNQVRNGNLKVTQKESNKILNISLTQAASKVSYNYSFTVNPKELTFVNTEELKTVDVTHTKQKLVNDKPSGSPIKVAFDVEIAGAGFSYDIIDSGVNVTASENPGTSKRTGTITISSQESEDSTNATETQRTGSAVITQNESNKTATVTLTQEAGASA